MFNPAARVRTLAVGGRALCHVIDDALLEPERWIDYAAAHAADFTDSPHNAYPGPELPLPDAVSAQFDGFFSRHLRRQFDVRRTLRAATRLSLATRRPEELEPRQWLCHVDRMRAEPGERIVASVLYLFRDEALGGTGFFRPLHPLPEIARLVQDSAALAPAEFHATRGVKAGYMTASNAWFEKIAAVPARFNRLIFYSGMTFHAADIAHPGRLAADPRSGRLTLNGFFTCRRNLA